MNIGGTYFANDEVSQMSFYPTIREYGDVTVRLKNGKSYVFSCSFKQYDKAIEKLEKEMSK